VSVSSRVFFSERASDDDDNDDGGDGCDGCDGGGGPVLNKTIFDTQAYLVKVTTTVAMCVALSTLVLKGRRCYFLLGQEEERLCRQRRCAPLSPFLLLLYVRVAAAQGLQTGARRR